MGDKREFIIEDFVPEETICNIDIEELDIAKLPLIEGDNHE